MIHNWNDSLNSSFNNIKQNNKKSVLFLVLKKKWNVFLNMVNENLKT